MTDRRARLKEIFFRASELSPSEVPGFLTEACEGDAELRSEVESLLGHKTDTDWFGVTPGGRPPSTAGDAPPRFKPGEVVGSRYRVATRVGRGGMGEVYRAEDMKLGQDVALKFLPLERATDPAWMGALHNEVRMSRRVSHANVCRVHDIGQEGEEPFITMEFVEGEDLASLLQQIGRFPPGRAREIGRQICFGLAAAHARGVLHRDLKPANVMVDAEGRVRITDFGLAVQQVDGVNPGSGGTPAYMAPEQLLGQPPSERTDVFALGAVLYELLTGKPAFAARALRDRDPDADGPEGPPPSKVSASVPTALDSVVTRCLRADPDLRPASAIELAFELAEGDPVEAAVRAGMTPPPEMLAATPTAEPISRAGVLVLLLVFLASLLGGAHLAGIYAPIQAGALPKPPQVLEEHALTLLEDALPERGNPYRSGGFYWETFLPVQGGVVDDTWLLHDFAEEELAGGAPYYWYREAGEPLIPESVFQIIEHNGLTTLDDPRMRLEGEVKLLLDPDGNLTLMESLPISGAPPPAPPDWARFFEAAGLEPDDFLEAEPEVLLVLPHQQRWAWVGGHVTDPDREVRVEAAALEDWPTWFAVLEPGGDDLEVAEAIVPRETADRLFAVVYLLTFLIAARWAWRNHRTGRSDTRGTFRLACTWFTLRMLSWVFGGSHAGNVDHELSLAVAIAGSALYETLFLWVLYTALEPLVRRHSPGILTSWSRALLGRWRDPLVGRDVLLGCTFGALLVAVEYTFDSIQLERWPMMDPTSDTIVETLLGTRHRLAVALDLPLQGIFDGVRWCLELALLLAIFRSPALAATLLIFIHASLLALTEALTLPGVAVSVTMPLIMIVVLVRYGLLPTCAAMTAVWALSSYPVMLRMNTWYAEASLFGIAVVLAMATYGAWVCMPREDLNAARS